MKDLALQILNEYGYWGILLLTALESIFPIIPAEILLTLSGFMTTYTDLTRIGVILYATIGELIGSLILYSIGRFFKIERLTHFTDLRIAKTIGFQKEQLYHTRDWFIQKGKYTVLFGRCIPVLGSLISIPAGMAEMNLLQFIVFTLIGISIWNTVLVILGAAAGSSWEIIANGAGTVSTVFAYLFVIIVIINGILLYQKHRKKKNVIKY
ncbi:DedA family protein [Anaeromicropila herbilytica]|uniref:Alkaline phosphatase-like protein n=1 Tax=Anaeromicropila herbilytica TaxID=2785025 RepID=A0A7R7EM55_9FIRM|nr:DedA family protein [Anaeromicropila herbilytica]BCN31156.1 alkaline phosphatase-like protein [Anaeromicropila herbilytica]